MADRDYIIKRVKEVALSFDPEAEVILYGSRARGTAEDDSDWDFLVLTSIECNSKIKTDISLAIFNVELETGEVLIPIIHNREYWHRPHNLISPFYKNVFADGITL